MACVVNLQTITVTLSPLPGEKYPISLCKAPLYLNQILLGPSLAILLTEKSMLVSTVPDSSLLVHPHAQIMHLLGFPPVFWKHRFTTYQRKFSPRSSLEIGNIWHLSWKHLLYIRSLVRSVTAPSCPYAAWQWETEHQPGKVGDCPIWPKHTFTIANTWGRVCFCIRDTQQGKYTAALL